MRAKTFKGGIHPKEMKELSKDCPIMDVFPSSKTVTIPVTQGGAPNTPVVNVGDYVVKGQIISNSTAPLSCPVHASITGTVKKITTHSVAGSGEALCIVPGYGRVAVIQADAVLIATDRIVVTYYIDGEAVDMVFDGA